MAQSPTNPPQPNVEMASYLAIPEERRAAAKAHVALVSATVRKIALELPLTADVDDFRRVLTAENGK